MTSALDGGEWSVSRPGRASPPGKGPPVPIVQEAGCTPEPVWTQVRGKILCPCRESNLDRPVVQPVVRHYTAWATLVPAIRVRAVTNVGRILMENTFKTDGMKTNLNTPAIMKLVLRV
jgi:hypothetical protein